MILIISGTNRPGSNTRNVAAHVEAGYKALGVKTQLLDLAELPPEIFLPSSYAKKPAAFKKFTDAVLASEGLVVITPEYNGGVPGIGKLMNEAGKFFGPDMGKRLGKQAEGFVGFVESLRKKKLR